jgi:hypothetical protein
VRFSKPLTNTPIRLFLSHAAADADLAKTVVSLTTAAGLAVYIYEHDPQPGESVADKLKQRISECDAFLVLLTENSQTSAYVQHEVGFAVGIGKPVIPLVTPGFETRRMAMLAGREYIELNLLDLDRSLRPLFKHLQAQPARPKSKVLSTTPHTERNVRRMPPRTLAPDPARGSGPKTGDAQERHVAQQPVRTVAARDVEGPHAARALRANPAAPAPPPPTMVTGMSGTDGSLVLTGPSHLPSSVDSKAPIPPNGTSRSAEKERHKTRWPWVLLAVLLAGTASLFLFPALFPATNDRASPPADQSNGTVLASPPDSTDAVTSVPMRDTARVRSHVCWTCDGEGRIATRLLWTCDVCGWCGEVSKMYEARSHLHHYSGEADNRFCDSCYQKLCAGQLDYFRDPRHIVGRDSNGKVTGYNSTQGRYTVVEETCPNCGGTGVDTYHGN